MVAAALRLVLRPAGQAVLVVALLVAGGARVASHQPPPRPDPARLYAALAGARAVGTSVEVLDAGGSVTERAAGTLDLAAQRARLRVDLDRFRRAPYVEVWDRSFTYVSPGGGRWYRFTGGTGPAGRAFYLLLQLTDAPRLSYEGRTTVRGEPTRRWAVTVPTGRLKVYVDRTGLPRRVELHQGNVVRVDLHSYFVTDEITVPARYTPVPDREAALRTAGAP